MTQNNPVITRYESNMKSMSLSQNWWTWLIMELIQMVLLINRLDFNL